jgi:hypothetical protein
VSDEKMRATASKGGGGVVWRNQYGSGVIASRAKGGRPPLLSDSERGAAGAQRDTSSLMEEEEEDEDEDEQDMGGGGGRGGSNSHQRRGAEEDPRPVDIHHGGRRHGQPINGPVPVWRANQRGLGRIPSESTRAPYTLNPNP